MKDPHILVNAYSKIQAIQVTENQAQAMRNRGILHVYDTKRQAYAVKRRLERNERKPLATNS